MFFIVEEEAAVDGVESRDLDLTLSPSLILLPSASSSRCDETRRLDALADAHEHAVVDDADHLRVVDDACPAGTR